MGGGWRAHGAARDAAGARRSPRSGGEGRPGPTEMVVIADESADPRWIAADLLSQAEHGEDSLAILLTPGAALARAVAGEVERQLETLPRRAIAAACLERRGWAIVT